MILNFCMGAFVILMFRLLSPNTLRIDWDAIARFVGFMVLLSFLRLGLQDLQAKIDPTYLPGMNATLQEMPTLWFGMVWWEDGFYVLPMVAAFRYLKKSHAFLVAAILSVFFAKGHSYQGILAVFVTAFYPYFISYKIGIKYGFGTVMVGHVLYDFFTFYTTVISRLIISFY